MVPLDSAVGWEVLSFSRIAPNEVTFGATGLRIDVRRSAGPIVYPLPTPLIVSRVRAKGFVSQHLVLSAPSVQGQGGADDYAIRVGLVESGTRRLGRLQRVAAAAWVKRLFALAPDGAGISQVRFLNVAEPGGRVGAVRRHPLSDLLYEQVVTTVDVERRFAIDHLLERPTQVVALWLSSDGDDTASTFSVTLEQLELD
jgi:hypothetical protein